MPAPLTETETTSVEPTRLSSYEWDVQLSGAIGPWDALLLDEVLLDILDQVGTHVTIDLADATVLDPVAIRVIFEAAERQRRAGGDLFLRARAHRWPGRVIRAVPPRDDVALLVGLHPALDRGLARRRLTAVS